MALALTFDYLIGKTITSATKMVKDDYDDTGYLKLEFSDGTSVVIVGGFDGDWTGDSEGEYKTTIGIVDSIDGLREPDED